MMMMTMMMMMMMMMMMGDSNKVKWKIWTAHRRSTLQNYFLDLYYFREKLLVPCLMFTGCLNEPFWMKYEVLDFREKYFVLCLGGIG